MRVPGARVEPQSAVTLLRQSLQQRDRGTGEGVEQHRRAAVVGQAPGLFRIGGRSILRLHVDQGRGELLAGKSVERDFFHWFALAVSPGWVGHYPLTPPP